MRLLRSNNLNNALVPLPVVAVIGHKTLDYRATGAPTLRSLHYHFPCCRIVKILLTTYEQSDKPVLVFHRSRLHSNTIGTQAATTIKAMTITWKVILSVSDIVASNVREQYSVVHWYMPP